ncbi:MAG: DUF2155 domain-containing protein [Deltaproteobacteria bacterium]|nr:DUF2155 domain-containing protein [Deltaproteobacteria bacterium]
MKSWKIVLMTIAVCALILSVGCKSASETPKPADDPHAGHDHGDGKSDPDGKMPAMPPEHPPMDKSMGGAMGGAMGKPMMPEGGHQIVVPDDVKAKFKSVKLNFGKKGEQPTAVEAKVGEETKLGDSGLTVFVEAFLPAFYMDSTRISSISTELTNPAVRVAIKEKGQEIHKGWLFAKMPTVHPFEHATYTLTLVEGVADPNAPKSAAPPAPEAPAPAAPTAPPTAPPATNG